MRNPLWAAAAAAFLVVGVGGVALAQASTEALISQVRGMAIQARTGNVEAAIKAVALSEAAAAANPKDARLWSLLGSAYLSQASLAVQPGGRFADAPPLFSKAVGAYDKALALEPNQGEALAGRGISGLISTQLTGGKPGPEHVALLNRGVAASPKSVTVRLQRAFTGVNLPDALRNPANDAEDLIYVANYARGLRSGDYVRLLPADVHAEQGRKDAARAEYLTVAKAASPAAGEAKGRLAALDGAGVTEAEIKQLRGRIGTNCAMCHGG